jgi:TonB family protein
MCEGSASVLLEESPPACAPDLRLLVELPSWPRVFLGNLRDLLYPRRHPPLRLRSAPAPFWHDVFVNRGLPWRRFLQSGAYHVLALTLLITASHLIPSEPQPAPRAAFDHAQVIYYQPAEYLPALDTRRPNAVPPQKADPELSRQPIISVPREVDNRAQTLVTPPDIKLKRDVPLPNIVAWSEKIWLPIVPAPLVPASSITRIAPRIENSVVAPPPDPTRIANHRDAPTIQATIVAPPPDIHVSVKAASQAPQPAVIAPPPSVDRASVRPVGEMSIAPSAVIAPAPQLPVGAQRAIPGAVADVSRSAPQVVPPPPSLSGSASSGAKGRVIALNLHPTVGAPPDSPPGNRRGAFAATPEGHAGAMGTPGSAGGGAGSSRENGKESTPSDLPAGLYVGRAANQPAAKTGPVAGDPKASSSQPANSANPVLAANIPPPRVTAPPHPAKPESATNLTEPEREVFANRKFYALTLNMPNLNSAGGTWVVRFAELKKDSSSGALSAPSATRKVDPAYPMELMRENVAGTVILYAVIHVDGSVGNIRILRSVDNRLDEFAAQAVAQWHFQPATRDGVPVDVEATFHIPFRPPQKNY